MVEFKETLVIIGQSIDIRISIMIGQKGTKTVNEVKLTATVRNG